MVSSTICRHQGLLLPHSGPRRVTHRALADESKSANLPSNTTQDVSLLENFLPNPDVAPFPANILADLDLREQFDFGLFARRLVAREDFSVFHHDTGVGSGWQRRSRVDAVDVAGCELGGRELGHDFVDSSGITSCQKKATQSAHPFSLNP
jgi:hypothetical protein